MPRTPLAAYRNKRRAPNTPEPFGGAPLGDCLRFVVQKHAATRTHYDFRLEWQGVLLSWAVPRGPDLDPQEKRLAVHVEDHPLDYTTFEGVIPAGNYGAGAVIVWDYGRWVPLEDPTTGMQRGKLLFELFGYKLRGVWTLVLPKKTGRDWLLIKKPDAGTQVVIDEASILSGLTVQEREMGGKKLTPPGWLTQAPRFMGTLASVKPMLAKRGTQVFTDPAWLFEVKYDGFRLLGGKENTTVQLRYRSGLDATGLYPEVTRALASLPVGQCILDGELVVHNAEGLPSFGALQDRALLSDPRAIGRASVAAPATLYVFDVLAWEGQDVRGVPLTERKAWLAQVLPKRGPLHYVDHVEAQGEALFVQAQRLGLEGLVAKRRASTYLGSRSDAWLKLPVYLQETFTVVGYSLPQGFRQGIGALHVAQANRLGVMRYAGAVGSGMDEATLSALFDRLKTAHQKKPSCEKVPAGLRVQWVQPQLQVLVRYKERTQGGHLRQPVFVHLTAHVPAAPLTDVPREVKRTHTDKVFWPKTGHTKGDLLAYYESVAEVMLPYLRERPVVLTRYPDGIDGKSFFQKDAPVWTPSWLQTVALWSEEKQRDISAFVCNDVDALLYLANLGTIPMHIWSSRITALGQPDFCILDLDPKDTPFTQVIAVAQEIRCLCDECGLPAYLKTSGSTGLHVLIALGGALTHEQSRQLAGLIGRVIVQRMPKVATIERPMAARKGKIYIDTLQNGHGKLIVAPYCVRPVEGALVSTPLRWSELKKTLDFRRYSIDTVPARIKKLRDDPMAPLLTVSAPLLPALEKLSTYLA